MTTQTIDTKACLSADMELTSKAIVVFPIHGEAGPEHTWFGGWDTTCATLPNSKEPCFWHAITFTIHGGAEAHQERIQRDLTVTAQRLGNVMAFLVGEVADCLYAALAWAGIWGSHRRPGCRGRRRPRRGAGRSGSVRTVHQAMVGNHEVGRRGPHHHRRSVPSAHPIDAQHGIADARPVKNDADVAHPVD